MEGLQAAEWERRQRRHRGLQFRAYDAAGAFNAFSAAARAFSNGLINGSTPSYVAYYLHPNVLCYTVDKDNPFQTSSCVACELTKAWGGTSGTGGRAHFQLVKPNAPSGSGIDSDPFVLTGTGSWQDFDKSHPDPCNYYFQMVNNNARYPGGNYLLTYMWISSPNYPSLPPPPQFPKSMRDR